MHVLANEQQRLLPRQPFKLLEQGGKGLSPLLHGTEAQRWIPLAGRDRKQRGNERRRVGHLPRSKRKHCLELVEFLLRAIL